MMVHGVAKVHWWTDRFTFKPQPIVHRVKTQATVLDGDAPIGSSKVGILDLRPPPATIEYSLPKGPKAKKTPQTVAAHVPPHLAAQPGTRLSNKKSGKNEICKQLNTGSCPHR